MLIRVEWPGEASPQLRPGTVSQSCRGGSWPCAGSGRLRCDVAARLTASAPQQTSNAPASWIAVGCSPSTTAASSIEAAGWSSSSSEDTAAGTLGSDEGIRSEEDTAEL